MSRLLAVKATLRATRGGKMALCSTLPARFRVQRVLDPCKFASDEIELKMGVKSAILAVSTPLKIPSARVLGEKKRACHNDRDSQLPPNQAVRTDFRRVLQW